MKRLIILFVFSFIELQTKPFSSTHRAMKKDPKVQVLIAYYARKKNIANTSLQQSNQNSKLNKHKNKLYTLTV